MTRSELATIKDFGSYIRTRREHAWRMSRTAANSFSMVAWETVGQEWDDLLRVWDRQIRPLTGAEKNT